MKTALSVVLVGIVLVGCGDDSRHRAYSGEPLAAESAQRNTPQAPHEEATVKPGEPEAIFPGIKPVFVSRVGELRLIEAYCQQRGIRRIGRDRVRLFIQPMGVVADPIEIDLANRRLTVYPGTHSRKKIVQRQLDEQQSAQIRALVTSDKFKRIPRENKRFGFDGTSYLVEVSIGGAYSWKLHWGPDDKEFMKVIDDIRALARKKVREPPAQAAGEDGAVEKARANARDRGLAWLAKNQAADGSWGKQYTVAVTGFACLAQLAAADEPFQGDQGRRLVRGLNYLLSQQKEGMFVRQRRTWIHGQGFATLALSEAYGRSLTCKMKPDLDMKKVRQVVSQAVRHIAKHQSASGGWWYTPGSSGQHEGSTTVCAVQALVSADNYGIEIDKAVLARGFEYLKKCQNPDGGFDYQLGPGTTSMKEGTAGGVATLGLMKKFDYMVMMKGYQFLLKITPQAISGERFPYYGHFYGTMGMRLLGQEFKSFREKTDGYIAGAQKDLLAWQQEDGSWPVKAWVKNTGETDAYATAFTTLTLSVPDGRLSIFNRDRPKLEHAREGKQ